MERQLGRSASTAGLDPPMRPPVSRFEIDFQSEKEFRYPQLHKFLELYGNQVRDLHIGWERLMCFTKQELNFCQQLPNLKSFSIQQDMMFYSTRHLKPTEPPVPLPKAFSKLTTLKFQDISGFPVWQLIELCTNVKTLAFRNMDGSEENFRRLLQILEGQLKLLTHCLILTIFLTWRAFPTWRQLSWIWISPNHWLITRTRFTRWSPGIWEYSRLKKCPTCKN